MQITPMRKTTRTTGGGSKKARTNVTKKAISRFKPGTVGFSPVRSLVDMGLGFPQKLKTRLKYRETVELSAASGSMATYLFRANSIFDPNLTGTGHQPLFHDQLAALYSYYTVMWSKITVRWMHDSTGNTAITCALSENEDSTVTPTNVDGVIEQGLAKSCTLGPAYDSTKELSTYYSYRQRFGGKDIDNTDNRAFFGANPSDAHFFQLNTQPVDRASSLSVFAEVVIEYSVVCSDLREIAQS